MAKNIAFHKRGVPIVLGNSIKKPSLIKFQYHPPLIIVLMIMAMIVLMIVPMFVLMIVAMHNSVRCITMAIMLYL